MTDGPFAAAGSGETGRLYRPGRRRPYAERQTCACATSAV
jgi:hypothetical protein